MAVTKYLDKTGLTYFCSKIKAWCNSLFALDSTVVHKTGNEGISGTKTFNSQIVGTIGKSVGDGGYADMVQTYQSDNGASHSCTVRCTNGDGFNEIIVGVHNESNGSPVGISVRNTDGVLTSTFGGSLRLTSTNDVSAESDSNPPLVIGNVSSRHLELDDNEIMSKVGVSGVNALFINRDGGDVFIGGYDTDHKSVTGRGKGSSTVPVYTDADGIVTACGNSLAVGITGNAATATKFAAPITINGVSFDGSANITVADSTKVSKSGDTMTGDLIISKTAPHLETKNTSITRGTAPSSNIAVAEILGRDSAGKSTWALYHTYTTDKTHRIRLLCYNGLTTDTTSAEIGIGYDSDGNPYTNAPTPSSTTDSTTKIATTRWVRTATGNFACNAATATQASFLQYKPTGINLDTPPTSLTEKYCLSIVKSDAQTVNTGNYLRLGVSQSANDKDYRITFGVSNPRTSNLPSAESIAGGNDDPDASTSNCWGCIGVYYDYSKNRAFPYCSGLSTCDLTDNGTNRLATNYWVRNATGNFACNASTATAFASNKSVTLTGAVTGTVSSTGGWIVPTIWRSCIIGRTDSGTSNPWYKVASRKLNGGSSTYNITFYIENANTASKFFGILRVSIGTNSDRTINTGVTKFAWLVNNGFAEEDFVLVCPATAEPTVELWTKVAGGYLRRRFVVISEGSNVSTEILWTLFDTVSAGQEASIPTEGTQVASAISELYGSIVPSSGGVVVKRSGTNNLTSFYGGTESYDGGKLELYGGTRSTNPGSFALTASIDSSTSTQLLGKPDGTLKWGGQAIQISSDERLKTLLSSVPDAVLDAWEEVNWGQFQYLDAIAKKGESARLHLGLIAQHVMSVFEKHRFDACAYGILCHEEDDGEGKDIWMVRYAEALAMEATYQRRKNKILENRISELENQLSSVLQTLKELKGVG